MRGILLAMPSAVKTRALIAPLCGALLALVVSARPVSAQTLPSQERLCDPTFEDCRADILKYIQQETVEIDMGFWMMTDARYSNELVKAWQRGVKIRLLMDPRCVQEHSPCATQNDQLAAAGIPMRNRATSGILHWKMILFAGQGQLEFAGANFAPFELAPDTPWQNFTDEIVMFTNEPSIVHSFMRKFDDLWVSTTEFQNYANITAPLTRSYPIYPIDPQLNFPPDDSYRARSTQAYAQEQQAIDVLMFRITDEQQSNAIIAAVNRGVQVRLITDSGEYRNPKRLWDSYNVDKMYAAGVQVRVDDHQGINHEKAILLRSLGMSIFGSSNWTSPSSDSQREHNMFTTQPWIYDWIENQFTRKWTNGHGTSETKPFVPLPPNVPAYHFPANGATNVATTGMALEWDAGLWAHKYDIYFGTTPNPPLLEANKLLGPSQYSTDYRRYPLPDLLPGTTYYWKIVSKTMALVSANGPVWSFTTAGTAPSNVPPGVTLTSPANGAHYNEPATITFTASASDSDGTIAQVAFYSGSTLLGTDNTAPFTFSWTNVPAGSYSLTAVATDNGNATATSAPVSVTVGSGTASLPAGWSHQDVGATGAAGGATFANGTFSITGAGADVWGTADAFQFAYRTLNGDGSIVARVNSIQNVNAWTKAGVMMRGSLSDSSAQGFMLVAASSAKGSRFQRRTSNGGITTDSTGAFVTAPYWVKLERAGNTITASESPDGATWTVVGTDTFAMGSSILVGLAVSSHVTGTNATATFDNVTVTAANQPSNTPPTASLTSPANGATYTAPASITVTANASDSDGSIARVDFYAGSSLIGSKTSAPYTVTWNNVAAGTYSLTAVATDNGGAATTTPAVSVTVSEPSSLPAGWSHQDVGATGATGNASYASNTFSVTGAGADVWGTADAFHYAYTTLDGDGTIVARVKTIQFVHAWTKAGVMMRSSLSPSAAYAYMLVAASSAKGAPFQRRTADGAEAVNTAGPLVTAPYWVKLVRAGDVITAYTSPDGATWTMVGSDTFAMGSSIVVGLAVSSHVAGTNATATFDNVAITGGGAPANTPPTVSLSNPADGATFTAPATIDLAASASDADGTISSVKFYAGATLVATANAAPYQVTWSNVPEGSYTLTAVASDDDGAATTSAPVHVTVDAAPASEPLPAEWAQADIGATPFAGTATYHDGAYTVTGSGKDVWDSSDAFHYVYQPLSSDGTIIARVAAVPTDVDRWVKAGVMMRASLEPDAAHAFMLVSAGKGLAFQRRVATGGTSTSTSGTAGAAPYWVKLTREQDNFSAYESADGAAWTLVGTETVPMPDTIYAGLAVTSHTTDASATCVFDDVAVQ
jgi:regulation of enolase protein 1 (concanavalin A-like superfamily)